MRYYHEVLINWCMLLIRENSIIIMLVNNL